MEKSIMSHEVESSSDIQLSKRSFKCKNKKCQNEIAIEEEGYYYCENCGCSEVSKDDVELVSGFDYNSSFVPIKNSSPHLTIDVPKAISNCHKTSVFNIAPGQRQAQEKIKLIAQNYDVTKEMEEIAIKIFDSIYPTIKRQSIKLKETVASCCLYKVLETNCVPVARREFIINNHLKIKQFYQALKLVNPKFSNVSNQSSSNASSQSSSNASSQSDKIRAILGQGNIKVEEFEDLFKRCEQILNLAERCWLLTGRSTEPLVIACSYFAYRLHLIDYRDVHWSRVDFREFCRRFQISKSSTAYKRKNELVSLFLTLAQNHLNPMYDGSKLSERDIETHLKYILMFSEEIIKDFIASRTNSSVEISEEAESLILGTFRKDQKFSSDVKHEDCSELTDEQAASLNKLPDEDLIKEEEMEEYIKSPEEVAKYQEIWSTVTEDPPFIHEELEYMLFQGLPKYERVAKSVKKQAKK